MKGKLILLEGIDGSGRSTQSKKLANYLKEKGVDSEWLTYRGPEGNPIAKLILDYLYKKLDIPIETVLMLFCALHTQNTARIKKFLSEGKRVVLDRYFPSAVAYQGVQGVGVEKAKKIGEPLSLKPDVILYLKVSPKTGMKRKQKQKREIDRHEEDLKLQQRVSDEYDRLADENFLGPWFIIDAEKSLEDVFSEIKNVAKNLL